MPAKSLEGFSDFMHEEDAGCNSDRIANGPRFPFADFQKDLIAIGHECQGPTHEIQIPDFPFKWPGFLAIHLGPEFRSRVRIRSIS